MLNAMEILEDDPAVIKADPRKVPLGANNQLISNVSFEFGQTGYYTAKATFTDANN